MIKYFLEWLRERIKSNSQPQNDYRNGYLDALEEIETVVQYGTFDDVIYVKLKDEYNIDGLKHNKEYQSCSTFGGEYIEIINEELEVIQYYERCKFDVLKIYNAFDKKYVTKDDIEQLNIKNRKFSEYK